MKSPVILLFLMMFSFSTVWGATGCLTGTTLYPNFAGYSTVTIIPSLSLGTPIYYNTGPYTTNVGTCPGWARVNSTGGTCIHGAATLGLVVGGFQIAICVGCPTGVIVDYTFINCDLDDYSSLIAIAAGSFGFLVLRKRKLV